MAEVKLKAKKRESSTKGALNQLRRDGFVPGVFYKRGEENIPIYVHQSNINPVVYTSESHLIVLEVEGDDNLHESVLKEIQFDPVTDKIVHFDLRGITRGEVIVIEVPLSLKGTPVGVKEGGIIQHGLHKLEIEVLPKDIPEHLELDISELGFGDSIQVKDLNFENIKVLNPESAVVVSIVAPRAIEEEKPEEELVGEEETEEPEVIKKGKAEEGAEDQENESKE